MDTYNLLQAILDFFTPVHSAGMIVHQRLAPLVIPLITTLLSTASTLYANEQTKDNEKEKKKLLDERQGSIDAWYKKESQPFLETESGKSLQSMLLGQYGKVMEQNRNNQIAGGGTAESDVAFRGKVLDSYNNTVLGAAANGENRRLSTNSQYQNQLTDMLGRKEASFDASSQNWVNTLAGISSLLGGVNAAYGEGGFGGGTPSTDPAVLKYK